MKRDECAIRSDAAPMLEKSGETMHPYLPRLLPHGDHATALCKVEIMDTTVPVRLLSVIEVVVRWSTGLKRHAKHSEPKERSPPPEPLH
jgi:hypothetical protein